MMMFRSSKNAIFLFLRGINTNTYKTQSLQPIVCYLYTFSMAIFANDRIEGNQNGTKTSKDDYFTAIRHISNILSISINSELVYRVLRACSKSSIESLRFLTWS
ncbi:hypothetical protein G4B88_027763 [Cannabis sativa]|uniref:Uncharacterized protein n=1 Tax=Cannabis sativa TaxID=3483 RepID=A0A7J6DZ18_CANSA|nr:hypothetical protein G4B88_027763 [Cannabis sativa]